MFRDGTDVALMEHVVEDMTSAPLGVGIAALRSAFLFRPSEVLEELNIPVIGINSDLYPVNIDAFRRHTASTFVVHIIENTGHFLMLEKPEAFNRKLWEAIATFEK